MTEQIRVQHSPPCEKCTHVYEDGCSGSNPLCVCYISKLLNMTIDDQKKLMLDIQHEIEYLKENKNKINNPFMTHEFKGKIEALLVVKDMLKNNLVKITKGENRKF